MSISRTSNKNYANLCVRMTIFWLPKLFYEQRKIREVCLHSNQQFYEQRLTIIFRQIFTLKANSFKIHKVTNSRRILLVDKGSGFLIELTILKGKFFKTFFFYYFDYPELLKSSFHIFFRPFAQEWVYFYNGKKGKSEKKKSQKMPSTKFPLVNKNVELLWIMVDELIF